MEDLGAKIEVLEEQIEWLKKELKSQEDYYKELLEQKEAECIQLQDELNNIRGFYY